MNIALNPFHPILFPVIGETAAPIDFAAAPPSACRTEAVLALFDKMIATIATLKSAVKIATTSPPWCIVHPLSTT